MIRNLSHVSQKMYDMAIIGSGIYGSFVAWDATLRGLSVVLIDQGDFACATSANHHKIIHGGLRYLQHADFKRMRESIRERSTLMRIAPHLVHPIPCLIPTFNDLTRGKLIMRIALKLNDLISFDRNHGLDPMNHIPDGRVLSQDDCLNLCPIFKPEGLTGGALFYDGQVHNTDRLNLSILKSASLAGADIYNYVKAIGFQMQGNTITGIMAQDIIGGKKLFIRARIIVNCSGPWIDNTLGYIKDNGINTKRGLFKAIVLCTRPLNTQVAIGYPSKIYYQDIGAIVKRGNRFFFITPWRNKSLVGTYYASFDGNPDDLKICKEEVDDFLKQINHSLPDANLTKKDIYHIYAGLLPRSENYSTKDDIQYEKHYRIYDHEIGDEIHGLISVMGVKYTTARDVAEKVVDLVQKKLGMHYLPSRTDITPICGGSIDQLNEFITKEVNQKSNTVNKDIIRHLINTYGSEYHQVFRYLDEKPDLAHQIISSSPVIRAEVVHGIELEMAQKLVDVIFRRTELGTAGYPGEECLQVCAEIMANILNWSEAQKYIEIEEVKSVYAKFGLLHLVEHEN